MGPVLFYWCRSSLKLALVFVTGLVLVGLPALASDALDMRMFGVALIVGFAWLANALAGRMRSTDPVVSVDDAGIFDRRIATAPFGWGEIRSVEAFEAESTHWVGFEFIDRRHSLAKTSRLVRVCAPLQRLMRFPSVSISMALLDGSTGDLIAAIRAHRPDLIRAES